MANPFFKNTGPHNISFLLKTINLKVDNLPDDNVIDIKDLNSSQKNEITFMSLILSSAMLLFFKSIDLSK